MMATEIIEIDAPWAEKWTKTRVSFLSAPTVNVKAVVAAFNKEKALVGAFSVITNLRMDLFEALVETASMLTCNKSL